MTKSQLRNDLDYLVRIIRTNHLEDTGMRRAKNRLYSCIEEWARLKEIATNRTDSEVEENS
jgi:hypothetical protein